jgi:DNA-binding NarL/FixJ family response regulator
VLPNAGASARTEVHVVEDHPLYRTVIAHALDATGDLRIGVAAGSVGELAAHRRPGGAVVILDLKLPGVCDAAAAGDRYVSPALAGHLHGAARERHRPVPFSLSDRERQVLTRTSPTRSASRCGRSGRIRIGSGRRPAAAGGPS